MSIVLYSDGSCLQGNTGAEGGPGGIGYVGLHNGLELQGSLGFFKTTNNRMEFQAVILPLEEIQTPSDIEVFTDSQYVINSMTKWIYGWEKKGWRKSDGGAVNNVDLIKRLQALMRYHSVKFNWVRGHTGDFYNEICDKLAYEAARNPTEVDSEFLMRFK